MLSVSKFGFCQTGACIHTVLLSLDLLLIANSCDDESSALTIAIASQASSHLSLKFLTMKGFSRMAVPSKDGYRSSFRSLRPEEKEQRGQRMAFKLQDP